MAGGVPGSTGAGQTIGHREIPWLSRFSVVHSRACIRLLWVGGADGLRPVAALEPAPFLGEHWRGSGGEEKYCGAKRFEVRHLHFPN